MQSSEENGKDNPREIKLQKLVKIILILGIIIIIPFIIVVTHNKESPNITIGILNTDKQMGNYPHDVTVGKNISLYFFAESHGFPDLNASVHQIIGNNSIQITQNGSSNGTIIQSVNFTLNSSQRWISNELNCSFSTPGNNSAEVFELWVDFGQGFQFYNLCYIRLNVTST